ncbi:hypothetical protein SDJN02_16395 [Cucurbita argyrosperma subsp. argyrosperma]|nr:hypothetical protein SDJN02_16395 [Cucurbita argyrosperma subsp. argyrosperma]
MAMNQTPSIPSMLSRDQLFHLFNRFSVIVSLSDSRFGISCLGKVNSFYENDLELMVRFYKFVAAEEMACDEAELEPYEFAEKMNNEHQLHKMQLEMLKHMRTLHSDDQSAILDKLHEQLESAEFDSSASIMSLEEIQEIVQTKGVSSPSVS